MTNDRIIRRWFHEIWNERKESTIDELAHPDIVARGLRNADGTEVKGIPEFKQFFKVFTAAFPDVRAEIDFTLSEGDKVMAFMRCTGTHKGDELGLKATHKGVDFNGVAVIRVKDGKAVEAWNVFDFVTMYQQLGVM